MNKPEEKCCAYLRKAVEEALGSLFVATDRQQSEEDRRQYALEAEVILRRALGVPKEHSE